jgi:hypothetical protein
MIIQMNLVSAILKELDKQGLKECPVSVLNKVIECANQIIAETERKQNMADHLMSYSEWITSDDTGMSSKWLATALFSAPSKNVSYPYDPSDFGRCYRMLKHVSGAKELFDQKFELLKEAGGIVWNRYLENWDLLVSLYEQESPKRICNKLYDTMQRLQKGATK